MRLFAFAVFLLLVSPAMAQPRMGLGEHPTLNESVRETHFIYLSLGNRYEYRVTHSENGQVVDPAFLRFTVINEFHPVAGADDFMVQVEVFGRERKLRQANCYLRLQRGRIHMLGVSQSSFSDCNYQSPFSQQDTVMDPSVSSIAIGGKSVSVTAAGAYELFWGDQNGDNGFISFRFAEGIGLYRFESMTYDSPFDPDPVSVSWVSELQYARVDGREYGISMVTEQFGTDAPAPANSPAQ